MTNLPEIHQRLLTIATLYRNYEFVDAHGNTHLVTQGSGGKWVNNTVVAHGPGSGMTKPPPDGRKVGTISAAAAIKAAAAPKGKAAGKGTSVAHEQFRELPINQITPNPTQPRQYFNQGALQELAKSIQENGLLQPITVRPHAGGYQIVAGERRWRAAQLAGQTHIKAIVRTLSDQQVKELALIENLNRQDMTPSETARAFKGLLDGGMSLKQLGEKSGKSAGVIQQHLDLLSIQPHLQNLVDSGRLRFSIVSPLSRLSPAGQEEAASRILQKDLGVKSGKDLIQTIYNRENQTSMFGTEAAKPSKVALDARDKYHAAMEQIAQALSGIDDTAMAHFAKIVDSPFKEGQRLSLMIKQLERMRRELSLSGHTQDTMSLAQSAADHAHLAPKTPRMMLAEIQRVRQRLHALVSDPQWYAGG